MANLDRRRLAVATAFTVVALPSLWLLERGKTSNRGTVSTAAAGVATPSPEATSSTSSTQFAPELPSFLDGPAAAPPPAVVDIAMPPPVNRPKVTASFRRYDSPAGTPCTTLLVPAGTEITLTNVDNGLSITCVNRLGVNLPAGIDLMMDTDLFSQIADLADAPVSVRLSW